MFTRPTGAPRTTTLIIAVAALGLLAGSCGDDTDSATDDGAPTSMPGMEDDDHVAFAFGESADPDDATRTVEVSMLDSLEYEPPSITVTQGETVLFEVTNDGALPHEFVIGDHDLQLEHEREMAEMEEDEMMHDEPNAVNVPPGEAKALAFTFTESGSLEFACHEPGHYDAGMIGELVVE